MGRQLRLIILPQGIWSSETKYIGVNVLEMEKDGSLYPQFFWDTEGHAPLINSRFIPNHFEIGIAVRGGILFTQDDAWNDTLSWLYASELRELRLPDDCHPWNKAVLAFVREMPGDTPIILYWF